MQTLGCTAEVEFFCNGQEIAKMTEFHIDMYFVLNNRNAILDEKREMWNNYQYEKEYAEAFYYKGQSQAQGCVATGAVRTQDLSGAPAHYSPDLTFHVNIEYVWLLSSGLEVSGGNDMTYSDEFQSNENTDPGSVPDSYANYDASINFK